MNNKRLIATILSCAMLVSFASCSQKTTETDEIESTTIEEVTETTTEESSEATTTLEETTTDSYVIKEDAIPESYMNIISIANDVITRSSSEYYESITDEDGFMGIYEETAALGEEEALSNICFSLKDINNDGIDELIISSKVKDDGLTEYVGPAYRAGYSVLAVYTLDGDDAVLIAEAWSRNSWYINSDGEFINEGSGGAAYHELGLYTLEANATELTNIYRLYTDFEIETETISLYEEVDGNIAVVDAEDIWSTMDNSCEQFTTEMLELELVPINSPLV